MCEVPLYGIGLRFLKGRSLTGVLAGSAGKRGLLLPNIRGSSSSILLLSSLEFSNSKLYGPEIPALLGAASHFCEVLPSFHSCSSLFFPFMIALDVLFLHDCSDCYPGRDLVVDPGRVCPIPSRSWSRFYGTYPPVGMQEAGTAVERIWHTRDSQG